MARSVQILFAAALFMASSLETNAQGYFPEIEWSRCYGSSENDEAIDIKQTIDGGYIVLGRSASTDGDLIDAPFGNKTWIFKLNAYGNIEWQQYWPIASFGKQPKNIVQTSDGGYIFGGPVFTKLKPNGDIDWQRNIVSEWVVEAQDGNYITNSDAYQYTKFNETALIWQKSHTVGWITSRAAAGLINYGDSNTLAYGSYTEEHMGTSFYIISLKSDGNIDTSSSGQDGYYTVIKERKNGDLLSIRQSGFSPGTGLGVMSSNFKFLWGHQFENLRPFDIMDNIDTTVVTTVRRTNYNTQQEARIIKISGNDTVNREYGGSGDETFQKILSTSDTGYVALGYTASNDGDVSGNHGENDIWVVKFKQDTSVHPLPPPVLSVNEVTNMDEAKVYPNPSTGKIFVDLPEGYERAEVRVLNMLGQEVTAAHSRNGRKETVQLNNSPAGIYLLEVKQGTERKTFRVTIDQ